ncbi:lipopolysaccharide assembly protein LapA domain-containing protein [Arthrobacter alpinus]|uniref:lipopolysaccharide assembly protein LapA domain-containing protein n=1 Tax=Arthrobacter alpinus TaxID=656366 RepID=UPI0009F932BE|nr:lipopolysaccharide assembly protein LapA domain-containing protein [Arthrobacter alpinus]
MSEDPDVPENAPLHPIEDRSLAKSTTGVTRASMMWVATAAGLLALVLLIIFILQNQDTVTLHYFGLNGTVSVGIGLFIASVGGGIVVAIAGAARIIQLRSRNRRDRLRS